MENNNIIDIKTGKPVEGDAVPDVSLEVSEEINKNKIRFNKVGILEATFSLLNKSEDFSELIQDLQYTRTDIEQPQIAANDDNFKKAA